MPSIRSLKIAAAGVLLAAATGCATVPGDPYYSGGYAPTPVYGGGTIYDAGVYPAYPVIRLENDRWEDMRDERERRAWRDRQAARDRYEREQAQRNRDDRARRDADRNRDERARREADRVRDQRSQWEREQRERELAQRQRDERARANAPGRNTDGSPRTDYDRYNPKTGQWLKRSEDMP